MSKIRVGSIGLLVFLFSLLFAPGGAAAQSGCLVPTFPKQVPGIEKWVCSPLVYPNSQTISRDSTIQAETGCGMWGCPPYAWSVTGTGFSISGSNRTNSDQEKVIIAADSTACGPGSITVTDACGATNTYVVRCTEGKWSLVGSAYRVEPPGKCVGVGGGSCSGGFEWEYEGQYGWRLVAFQCYKDCSNTSWGCILGSCVDPPCGNPHECDSGGCGSGEVCIPAFCDTFRWVCQ